MEKRQCYRLGKNIPVRTRLLESLKDPHQVFSEDFSSGGLRLFLKDEFQPQDRLELLISVPEEKDPVCAIARVIWVHKSKGIDLYETGLQFVYIEDEDLDRIFKYATTG